MRIARLLMGGQPVSRPIAASMTSEEADEGERLGATGLRRPTHSTAFAHGTHIYYGDGRAPADDALTAR